MTFTSPGFALFLSIVFLLYWLGFKKNALWQNVLLLIASLFFYTWYNWRFTPLLLISILFNFYAGKYINDRRSKAGGKWILWVGILFNLGLLLWFKYLGLFSSWSFTQSAIDPVNPLPDTVGILIPLGISFYTFQALGYIIDIYNEETNSCKSLLIFSTYITYFPKIVSGPIEPAKKMLPQLTVTREFDHTLAADGIRQILWGLFTKLVIANNCASFTEPVFADYSRYPGSTLLIAAFFYIFQVYCDFSGYSNIAIGVSKLFGIQLSRNFNAPFFSTNIREYWQKWHMTLTQWMMKYVFTPLSFTLRQYKKMGLIISITTTFVIVGLWHGAQWTFIVFGLLHGIYFIPLLLFPKTSPAGGRSSAFSKFVKMCGLFMLVMFTCIFFGSWSVKEAIDYIKRIFSRSLVSAPVWPVQAGNLKALSTLTFIFLLLIVEWAQRRQAHELQLDRVGNPYLRRMVYFSVVVLILLFGSVNYVQFFYAQF